MQWKVAEVVATVQTEETTTTPIEETKEGREMSMEKDIQWEAETEERTDPTPKSTQLKRLHVQEKPTTRKRTKTTKTSEGDLPDYGKPFHNVTKDALEELMTERKTMLGVLRA